MIANIVIGLIIMALFVLSVKHAIKRHRAGDCGCGCGKDCHCCKK